MAANQLCLQSGDSIKAIGCRDVGACDLRFGDSKTMQGPKTTEQIRFRARALGDNFLHLLKDC